MGSVKSGPGVTGAQQEEAIKGFQESFEDTAEPDDFMLDLTEDEQRKRKSARKRKPTTSRDDKPAKRRKKVA